MKKESNSESSAPAGKVTLFTTDLLKQLRQQGYQYVLVDAFTQDGRQDFIEAKYIILFPVMSLPEDINQKGVYEQIGSQLLDTWAANPDQGIQVFVANTQQ